MLTTLGIFIGSILGLLIISAFFSGSETALTAISKARIRHLADEGDKRAKALEKLIAKQAEGMVMITKDIQDNLR